MCVLSDNYERAAGIEKDAGYCIKINHDRGASTLFLKQLLVLPFSQTLLTRKDILSHASYNLFKQLLPFCFFTDAADAQRHPEPSRDTVLRG